ncbi:phage holin family protein [Pedobacter sp.]|uniref:phage holin family protein n=1 Tax=Pedobacter sp. TaxID=1411316 RepID=UPI00396C98BE
MEEKKEIKLEEIVAEAKEYVEERIEYIRLSTVEKGSKIAADLITNTVVAIGFTLAFLFGSVTLALFLSNLFESYVAGFGCVAGIYLLLSIIVFLTKDNIIEKWLVDLFIKKYFEKVADKDDEN